MNPLRYRNIKRCLNLRHALLIVCSLALFSGQGASLAYEATPGRLQEALTPLPAAGDHVAISGCIGDADFETLRSLGMTEGLSLDLSGLSTVSGRLPDGIFTESRLKELSWPGGVARIPTGALSYSPIERLVIPAAVRVIGEYAFSGCDRLGEVAGGQGVESIEEGAFDCCIALPTLPEMTNVDRVAPRAFASSGVERLSFPRATKLYPYALASAPRLESVTLGRDVELGRGALADCPALRSVAGLPSEVPDLLFALSPSMTLPDGDSNLIGIGAYAFAGNGAGRLYLSRGLREIQRGAFADMEGLTDIYALPLEGEIPLTDDDAFEGVVCEGITLHVDRQYADLWSAHPVWGRFIIKPEESGVENVSPDQEDIMISCSEGWLNITGDGIDRDVEVFTIGGTRLYRGSCRDSLRVNLNGCNEKILIVNMTGKRAVKLFLR